MAMTLRLSDKESEELRRQAAVEGRSMQQVARSAVEEYLARRIDDARTLALGYEEANRFRNLLRRLGE